MLRERYIVEEDTTITVTRLPAGAGGDGKTGEEPGAVAMVFGAIFWIVVILALIKGCA
jgi:hypothetical protein